MDLLKERLVSASQGDIDLDAAEAMVVNLLPAGTEDSGDKAVVGWLDGNTLETEYLVKSVTLQYSSKAVMDILNGLSTEDKAALLKKIV